MNNLDYSIEDIVTELNTKTAKCMEETAFTEEVSSSLEEFVASTQTEALFRGISEDGSDNEEDHNDVLLKKLGHEKKRFEMYASSAKGKKKASYEKRLRDIDEKEDALEHPISDLVKGGK